MRITDRNNSRHGVTFSSRWRRAKIADPSGWFTPSAPRVGAKKDQLHALQSFANPRPDGLLRVPAPSGII